MPAENLTRINFRDPSSTTKKPRAGNVADAEALQEVEGYDQLIEQVHGSGLHEWGVAFGFDVTVGPGSQTLIVGTGVAVDAAGKHISLAVRGNAESNPNIDNNGQSPIPLSVTPNPDPKKPTLGTVVFPTIAPVPGTYFLTVQWWETPSVTPDGLLLLTQTPWLKLQTPPGFQDNGTDGITLARVTIDATNKVTAIDAATRRGCGLPVQQIHLKKGAATGATSVDNVDVGGIGPHPSGAGGILVAVTGSGDEVHFQLGPDDHKPANFAKLAINADHVVAKRGGVETIVLNASTGSVIVGAKGIEGDVVVLDANGLHSVTLDGDFGLGVFGNPTMPGNIKVKAGPKGGRPVKLKVGREFGDAVLIEGLPPDRRNIWAVSDIAAGQNLWFGNALKSDIEGAYEKINFHNLRELTSGTPAAPSFTTLHSHFQDAGVVGLGGETGSRIGIISGNICINHRGPQQGGVFLWFRDGVFNGDSGSFFPDLSFSLGFRGTFTAIPHAIMSAVELNLTSHDQSDVHFNCFFEPFFDHIHFTWMFDEINQQFQTINFLIIGPIA